MSASSEKGSDKNIFEDADQDGLSNDEEKLYGTDPYERDTDGDGYGDGIEVESGFDPLKKAPGDKIVRNEEKSEDIVLIEGGVGGDNLTEKMTEEIAAVLENVSETENTVTMDQVDEAVQKALGGNSQEVILPEIDVEKIQVKRSPNDKGEVKKDILEYVTVLAYLVADNAPREIKTEEDFQNVVRSITEESVGAFSSGNMSYLNKLSSQGEKMLEEVESLEVPEEMLDIHIRTLQIAKYATGLKEEVNLNQTDPLGQIAVLSKVEALLGIADSLSADVTKKLSDFGIEALPIDI